MQVLQSARPFNNPLALIALQAECGKDPTAKWGTMAAGTSGPFAVCFAGGMRNFAAVWPSWKKNLVEPSVGVVHTFFHVWADENMHVSSPLGKQSRKLAKDLPSTRGYVDEPFNSHLQASVDPAWPIFARAVACGRSVLRPHDALAAPPALFAFLQPS